MKNYKDIDTWLAEGDKLAEWREGMNTEIAEWAYAGRQQFGEAAEQGYSKFSEWTISNYLSAMRRTPDSVIPANTKRRIGITARQAVAPLYDYPDVQRQLLAQYGAGTPREEIREAVADFLGTITPDDDENHAGVITETVWDDLETMEIESGDAGSLWTRIMRLLTTVRGRRIRFVIQVAKQVDVEANEVRNA